jgi:hypothetical protein
MFLLPDAKAMGNAIEVHINLHIQKLKVSSCVDAEVERLRDMLIAQVLDRAGESEEKAKTQHGKLESSKNLEFVFVKI